MAGSSGSKQPTQTNSTVTQNNIPEYVKPYYEDLLGRAQSAVNEPYTNYQGQRISGFTPDQQNTQAQVMGLQTPGQFNSASGMATTAGLASLNAGNYQAGNFNAQNVNAPGVGNFLMANQPNWDSAQSAHYMSPYMQDVVDVTKDEAIRDAQKSQLTDNLGAARLGTYGGSRQLLATTERERNLNQNLANIQAQGTQSAYENAQGQFNQDRNSMFNTGSQNLNSLLTSQGLRTNASLQAQQANQAAGLQTQQMGEQSRQFGANLGLQGLSQATQSAQVLGGLGAQQQEADLNRLQAQTSVGQQQQNLNQQYLDTAYADFLRQRDYPMEQLSFYNSLIHGLPASVNSTTTTYGQQPSTAAQVGGLGLAGLSMYNLMR